MGREGGKVVEVVIIDAAEIVVLECCFQFGLEVLETGGREG